MITDTNNVCRFRGCKHLDYEGEYVSCTKEWFVGIGVAWMRHELPYPGAPKMVQFCGKRGRLNHMSACLGACNAMCSDYDETEHVVEF